MKSSQKGSYIGAGVGLVIFAIAGLLPGSLLGGAMGINIAGFFFGLPLEPGVMQRVIVLLSMLVGVMVSGILCVVSASTVGYLVGALFNSESKEAVYEHNR